MTEKSNIKKKIFFKFSVASIFVQLFYIGGVIGITYFMVYLIIQTIKKWNDKATDLIYFILILIACLFFIIVFSFYECAHNTGLIRLEETGIRNKGN